MYKRIVVKVGTNLLVDDKGVKKGFLRSLVSQISSLHAKSKEIIIVSSGAIGLGARKLCLEKKPVNLSEKQAAAAIGQIMLMQAYESAFCAAGVSVAQVLLGHDDIKNRARNINARNTLNKLLEWKVIPVINENDTVATDEIKFGDNDTLAGIVGSLVSADIVVILTSVDGVFDKNPDTHSDARIITEINDIDEQEKNIDTQGKTSLGTGGMGAKLEIARKLNYAGIPLVIANGNREDVIEKIASGKNEGTIIRVKKDRLGSKKSYILMSLKEKGKLKVDDGAKTAVLSSGRSLLAVGICGVSGEFSFGDAVEIVDMKGLRIGKGIVNYSSKDLNAIKGRSNSSLKKELGDSFYEEVIHRDNLLIYK
ncbi:MAG: glutamate 5-kinase [Candidatus Goldiibacteriota bacterium]